MPKGGMLRQGWCLDGGHNLILTGRGLPICPVNLQISMIMGSLQFFSRAFCRGLQNFATVFVETDNFFQVLFDFFSIQFGLIAPSSQVSEELCTTGCDRPGPDLPVATLSPTPNFHRPVFTRKTATKAFNGGCRW